MSNEIDFSKYSQADLETAIYAINRDKFEERYQACLQEVERRKSTGDWQEKKSFDFSKIFVFFAYIFMFCSLIQVAVHSINFVDQLQTKNFERTLVEFFLGALATFSFYSFFRARRLDVKGLELSAYAVLPWLVEFQSSGWHYIYQFGPSLTLGWRSDEGVIGSVGFHLNSMLERTENTHFFIFINLAVPIWWGIIQSLKVRASRTTVSGT